MVIRIIYGARQDGNMEDRCVKETGSVDKQTEDRLGEGIKPRLERDKCEYNNLHSPIIKLCELRHAIVFDGIAMWLRPDIYRQIL